MHATRARSPCRARCSAARRCRSRRTARPRRRGRGRRPGVTTIGFLPPSSRQAVCRCRPVSSPIARPTAVEPVKPTLSIRPVLERLLQPVERGRAVGVHDVEHAVGQPAAADEQLVERVRARRRRTRPASRRRCCRTSSAGTMYQDGTATGKLPAVITATVPTGLRNVNSCLSGISLRHGLAVQPPALAEEEVAGVDDLRTSPSASAYGLPISRGDQRGPAPRRWPRPAGRCARSPGRAPARARPPTPAAPRAPPRAAATKRVGVAERDLGDDLVRAAPGWCSVRVPASRSPADPLTTELTVRCVTSMLARHQAPARRQRRRTRSSAAAPRSISSLAHRQRRTEADASARPHGSTRTCSLVVAGRATTASRMLARPAGRRRRNSPRPRTFETSAGVLGRRAPAARRAGTSPCSPAWLDQPVALDDLQQPAGADHVGQPAAPGRVDPAGDREHVVGTSSTRPPAMMPPSWTFLANATMSGLEAELLVGPRRCRSARRRSAPRRG